MPYPKGAPKPKNSGRKKGTPNKNTKLLKDAVLRAAELAGAARKSPKGTTGMEKYLYHLANEQPVAFTSLLNKVLPMQIGGVGDDGEGITINIKFE